MANLGVHVSEKATSVSTPVVADSGIPFFVGKAPAHTAEAPGAVNFPILATSWDEAVEQLGYCDDWGTYTLCEAIYSHFTLYGCQPAIFLNVLDSSSMTEAVEAKDYAVTDHKATLPFEAINDENLVVKNGETALTADVDYGVFYTSKSGVEGSCTVELLSSGTAYDATTLNIAYKAVKPSAVTVADIAAGVSEIDACMTAVGKIPDTICAPGYSHLSTVAAIMATKADSINGLFHGKAVIDIDSSSDGVTRCSGLPAYKNKNNLVDENQIVCWPMMKLGDYTFHMSTQLAGLMAQVDTDNEGIPYESPSNKNFQMDTCCLEDGTEVNLTWDQACIIADYGIVTAINFMSMGWTCRNNYTACYPSNTDVKDYFIPISRMFDWVGNTLIRTFWSKLDKPMNRRLLDNITDTCNIWLSGLVGQDYLLGARVEIIKSENPLTSLMAGIIKIHVYITPPSPAQEIDFVLEYDVNYVSSALTA